MRALSKPKASFSGKKRSKNSLARFFPEATFLGQQMKRLFLGNFKGLFKAKKPQKILSRFFLPQKVLGELDK